MARRKAPDYTVTVEYQSDPKDVSRRLTEALLRTYDKLSDEERERLCRRSLRDEEKEVV